MGGKGKFGIVLSVTAGAAFLYTLFMMGKKAPEALEAKNKALQEKRERTGDESAQLTLVESVKAQMPCYAPAILGGAVTLGSIVGSQLLPQEALNDINQVHKTYKDITAKMAGPKAEKLIESMTAQKISHGMDEPKKETFVLQFDDKDIQFESTMLSVMQATYDINRLFVGLGTVTFNQALQFFKQKEVERGDDFGWDAYLGEAWYGYSWIDFEYRQGKLNGKNVTFIDMPFEPHALCEEELEGEDAVEFGGEWTRQ